MTAKVEAPADGNGAEKDETAPSLDEQKDAIKVAESYPLKKGETWYITDTRWYKQWKKFVGCDSFYDTNKKGRPEDHPGPLDNSHLLKDKDVSKDDLKEHLIEDIDYSLFPQWAWEKLVAWYGLQEGQEPLARRVSEHGLYVKDLKVEVYLGALKLCTSNDPEKFIVRKFSKSTSLADVVVEIKVIFNIPEDEETRLWNKYMSSTFELLTNMNSTIQDASLYHGQVVMLERKKDGAWPRQTRTSSLSSSSALSSSPMESSSSSSATQPSYGSTYSSYGVFGNSDYNTRRRASSGSASSAGLCGLSNLGNTCFMNSALQCLSNTNYLTKYFLSENYKFELNPKNPLGMRGEIAKAYAELMHQMWSGSHSYVVPRNFKMQVGRFAPQFSGYNQQDSQELMAFLLDGLHEDLNRVLQKPYIEIPDAGSRPDEDVATEAWKNHVLRNDSVIVDTFHGQFKSTVVCPECDKVSVTFDPFCYMSLPLPVKKERQLDIIYIPLDPTKKPVVLKVIVPKLGTITELTEAVAKLIHAEADKLVACDVYNHRFHKIFERRDPLSHIADRDDIYVYEIPFSHAAYQETELIVAPVYLREQRAQSNNTYTSYGASSYLFGTPMLVPVPKKNMTYEDLYQIMVNSMRRFVRQPESKEFEKDMKKLQGENSDDESDSNEEDKIKQDNEGKENEDKEEEDEEMDTEDNDEKEKLARLFTIKTVNTYGSADLDTFKDDGTLLKLPSRMYLALDWHPTIRKKYFDSVAADQSEEHASVRDRPFAKKSINLKDCLNLFLSKEKLGADDPWYCPNCKKHQQASKKFDFWTLPKVLVIHLKRFSYSRWWRDKLDTLVDFPIRGLNLSEYVINKNHPKAVYDLHAVSNHYGGMGGGHYTAYAKNAHDGHWYYFDDSSVSAADESQIVSKAAYVVLYTRRDDPEHEPMAVNDLLSDDDDSIFIQTNLSDEEEKE